MKKTGAVGYNRLNIFIFFLVLFVTHINFFPYKYDLAIVAMFRNEGRFIKEWIEYHRLIGVQYFYLYNNSSTDNYEKILRPYVEKGIVEITNWNHYDGFHILDQAEAYQDALNKMKGVVKWIAFIDLDEFICPVIQDNLLTFLKDYEDYGGLCINWLFFGTSDIECINNDELMIERLTKCNPNYGSTVWVKSIVQPDRTISIPSAHFCQYKTPYFQVNADKIRFEGYLAPYATLDKVRINHYWPRDIKNLVEVKIPNSLLARAWEKEYAKKLQLIEWIIEDCKKLNTIQDTVIHKYLHRLKIKMNDNIA